MKPHRNGKEINLGPKFNNEEGKNPRIRIAESDVLRPNGMTESREIRVWEIYCHLIC